MAQDAMTAAVNDDALNPPALADPTTVWLLTVEWGSDGEGGYGWTRRSIHASRQRAQAAAAELVTAITEESLADLTVLRSTEDADWCHIEVDGGAYCLLAYSLEQMPVD